MCGVIGIVSHGPVNQLIYDGLMTLQHRGQDAAGIMTADGAVFHQHKARAWRATCSAPATCAICSATPALAMSATDGRQRGERA